MKIVLLRDWYGSPKDGSPARQFKAGDRLSVWHYAGAKLLCRQGAKWLGYDPGDPVYPDGQPPEPFRATPAERQAVPGADTMIHRSMHNK